jgi:hypothetical protein
VSKKSRKDQTPPGLLKTQIPLHSAAGNDKEADRFGRKSRATRSLHSLSIAERRGIINKIRTKAGKVRTVHFFVDSDRLENYSAQVAEDKTK